MTMRRLADIVVNVGNAAGQSAEDAREQDRRDAPLDLRQRGAQAVPHEDQRLSRSKSLASYEAPAFEQKARVQSLVGTPTDHLQSPRAAGRSERFSVAWKDTGCVAYAAHIYRRQGHSRTVPPPVGRGRGRRTGRNVSPAKACIDASTEKMTSHRRCNSGSQPRLWQKPGAAQRLPVGRVEGRGVHE